MIDRLFPPKPLPVERAEHNDLALQLKEANRAIIELQTLVRVQQENYRDMQRQVELAKEQSAIVSAANTAQREALQYQRRLIDQLTKDQTGMRVELDTTNKLAIQLTEENAMLRNDVVFWWSIALMYKNELGAHGIVKDVIEHNGIKC